MPNVEDQNCPLVVALVAYLVFPGVVEDDRLAVGPCVPLVIDADARAAAVEERQVDAESLVGRARVRSYVRARQNGGELNAGEVLLHSLQEGHGLGEV